MAITILKTCVPKQTPTVIKYRDYRQFNGQYFAQDLQNEIRSITDDTCYANFEFTFKTILNKHAPIKTKIVRANNAPYMNKTLSKPIMNRSTPQNVFPEVLIIASDYSTNSNEITV